MFTTHTFYVFYQFFYHFTFGFCSHLMYENNQRLYQFVGNLSLTTKAERC